MLPRIAHLSAVSRRYAVGDADTKTAIRHRLARTLSQPISPARLHRRLPACPTSASDGPGTGAPATSSSARRADGWHIQPHWIESLCRLARLGFDIVSGLHTRLGAIQDWPESYRRAWRSPGRCACTPPADLTVAGIGHQRSTLDHGQHRCAVGKIYRARDRSLPARNKVESRVSARPVKPASLIDGGGIPIDAVVCDFVAARRELLSPADGADHWDIVGDKGSLNIRGYAGVARLLHNARADALVLLTHDLSRTTIDGLAGHAIPATHGLYRALCPRAARLTNPARVASAFAVEMPPRYPMRISRVSVTSIEAETSLQQRTIRDGVDRFIAALDAAFG
jgi:hypothetical protein